MTGREKIQAAFSKAGTPEIPAVICYEGIYYRDHWSQLTSAPWWSAQDPDIQRQVAWQSEAIEKTGQDWFCLPWCYAKEERDSLFIDETSAGVYLADRLTGARRRLREPFVGGWDPERSYTQPDQVTGPRSFDEIDRAVPADAPFQRGQFLASGRGDLAADMLRRFGERLFPIEYVDSPLWACHNLWGFEGLMLQLCDRPDLVRHACERLLHNRCQWVRRAAAVGVAGIWIEECFTDSISPAQFAEFNVPVVRSLAEEIRAVGMKSVYYYCGNPADRWEHLLAVGADALSLEEGKKGFTIDIEDVVARVQGRCTVLGNLDAINLLPRASEDQLRAEIARQVAAGRKNGSRFIMSIGSPVTPQTNVRRVRRYCDLVHELSAGCSTEPLPPG